MNTTNSMGSTLEETVQAKQSPKKKILLIDDTKLIIELEKAVLERLTEVEVHVANNGHDALEIFERENPDLVFLDFYMDGMNGDECCRRIKEMTLSSPTPVIMVTSGGNESDYLDCWSAGCDAIMVKPLNHPLFLATAKKYLKIIRKDKRHAVANLKIKYGTGSQVDLTDYCVNLSMGGLFLATTNLLPVNSELRVEFSLPNRETPIECGAKVRWINNATDKAREELPSGMGISFSELSLDNLHTIREYLSVGGLKGVW